MKESPVPSPMTSLRAEAAPAAAPQGLAVVRGLLDRLHAAGIAYCHWKSNEHLAPALDGLTDLDVLVDRRQHLALQAVLADCGFKRFAATPLRGYPAVEDYLGFDRATGRLAHLHLHWQLTLGQRHLKGYRLPWEERLLATRRFDEAHGAYVADPHLELLLLLVRGILKQRLRDRLGLRLRRSRNDAADSRREFDWLRDRTDAAELGALGARLLGPGAENPLRAIHARPDDPAPRRALARAARPALARCRTWGPVSAGFRALGREALWIADAINRRTLHRPVPLRRVSPRGGTVIALLGSDGSGKSTLVRETTAWLGVKLDVVPIYFGSGDGPGSLLRLPLQLARRGLDALTGHAAKSGGDRSGAAAGPTPRSALRAAAMLPWALTLSLEKRGKLRRMTQARNRGMIVVCDRYAQADFPGFNDGPLLHHLAGSRWRLARALAAWEARPYADAGTAPPDLVLKLLAAPEVALSRRPEMSIEEIRRRLQAVERLRFAAPARVAEIRSDAPLEQVLLEARRIVWDEL